MQSPALLSIIAGPDITAVDSQYIEPPQSQLLYREPPLTDFLPSPASIQQAK